jgi:hypothetical protein
MLSRVGFFLRLPETNTVSKATSLSFLLPFLLSMEQLDRGWEVELTKRQQKTWYFYLILFQANTQERSL